MQKLKRQSITSKSTIVTHCTRTSLTAQTSASHHSMSLQMKAFARGNLFTCPKVRYHHSKTYTSWCLSVLSACLWPMHSVVTGTISIKLAKGMKAHGRKVVTAVSKLFSLGSNLEPAKNCHSVVSQATRFINVCAVPRMDVGHPIYRHWMVDIKSKFLPQLLLGEMLYGIEVQRLGGPRKRDNSVPVLIKPPSDNTWALWSGLWSLKTPLPAGKKCCIMGADHHSGR